MWSTRYVPNLETIYAFQGALVSANMTLHDLRMPRPPGALAADEMRYYIPAENLGAEHISGHAKRSCIRNGSGATRLELITSPRPTSCTDVIDCGSIGRPGKLYVYSKFGGAGMIWFDRLHTKYSRYKTAVMDAELWDTAWNEAAVLVSFRRGPWLGAANHTKMTGIFENYYATSDCKDALFRFAYPYIIFFMYRGQLPGNAYSEEHYQQIWDELPCRPLLRHPGSRAKKSRWYQLPQDVLSMKQDFGLLMLLCLRQAVESGFYPSLKDTPFAGRSARAAEGAAGGGEAASGSGARGSADPAPAESREVDKAPEAKTQGQIVCSVLCDWSRLRAVILFPLAGQPQMKSFHEEYALLKTRMGTHEWWRAMATGHWESTLLALSLQFSNRSLLQDR